MDFGFGLIAIFLIFGMTSSRSIGNGCSKKKRDSNNIELTSLHQLFVNNSNIFQNNSFLQSSSGNKSGNLISNGFPSQTSDIVFPDDNYNLFSNRNPQPSNDNKNGNSIMSNRFLSQTSDIVFPDDNVFSNFNRNPILNPTITDSMVDITSSSSSRPITQTSYTQTYTPYYTPVVNIPAFNTSDNDFATSPTPTPFKIHSSVPSLNDLLSIKSSSKKSISELKCEEYVREIATSISLIDSSSNERKINICGDANRLVIDGYEAEVGEFPHMVALGTREDNEFRLMCGGTLISHTWVLSAAQCIFYHSSNPIVVKIGIIRLSDKEGLTIDIKRIIKHPEYNRSQKYADIALLQLMNAVTFSTVIRPACLYQQYDTVSRKAWISGWGVTNWDDETPPDRLQKTQLDVIDNLFCSAQYNVSKELPYGITPSMICAGDPRGNWTKDSCSGDGGGPLQVHLEGECFFRVIGIVSFGMLCGTINFPGVYTRISYYLSWIEDNVWPQGR